MHEELWTGIQLKLDHARFHLEQMGKALEGPEHTTLNVILESHGARVGGNWDRAFYANLNAFLSAARSIPEVIQCCFGADTGSKETKDWFDKLPADEKIRRQQFKQQFANHYQAFRDLHLGSSRHESEHRIGYPGVEVTVIGQFGATHTGGPAKRIPLSETRQIDDPDLQFLAKPVALRPKLDNFTIDGKPLFGEFDAYIGHADALISKAKELSDRVHRAASLTRPLSNVCVPP